MLIIIFSPTFSRVSLILTQHDVVVDVANINALGDDDRTILSVVARVELRSVLQLECRSISRRVRAVRSLHLVVDWVNVELNQVVIQNRLVALSVIKSYEVNELLKSVWHDIHHGDRGVSDQLEAINRDHSVWRVVLLVPGSEIVANQAVSLVLRSSLLELSYIEHRKVILVNIQWLSLSDTTLALDLVISISVDDEHPDLGVEDRPVELVQNLRTISLTTDRVVDSLVVPEDPSVLGVVSDNISQLWHPDISVVEQNHSHVSVVSGE